MPNEVYDALKYVVTIIIPAAVVLYAAVGALVPTIPDPAVVCGVATAVDTFLAACIGVSSVVDAKRGASGGDGE
ncbi:phage holin [Eggerthella guodeyinii]|nr:phage holin [Eggerthella guodeyinii]